VDALISLSGFFGADGEGRGGVEGPGGEEGRRLEDGGCSWGIGSGWEDEAMDF